jgi:hypothetical protein
MSIYAISGVAFLAGMAFDQLLNQEFRMAAWNAWWSAVTGIIGYAVHHMAIP